MPIETTLDTTKVDLRSNEDLLCREAICSIMQAIIEGDKIPSVPVHQDPDDPDIFYISHLVTDDDWNLVGGNCRAYAHWLLGSPLPVRIQNGSIGNDREQMVSFSEKRTASNPYVFQKVKGGRAKYPRSQEGIMACYELVAEQSSPYKLEQAA
ncbi:hypothetical protein JW826_04915 [Candidatus Woesearchaeota archaeon]|nr:hypothetical protein [Candidatus Woesearchaeota archaeon]